MNVWLYGHELAFSADQYQSTLRTFSEYMRMLSRDQRYNNARINRMQNSQVMGVGDAFRDDDPAHSVPALPAGARLLEAFVCDGPGFNWQTGLYPYEEAVYGNAGFFAGRATPGLININTAPVEVMRTLPHWYKLIHHHMLADPTLYVPLSPRSLVPEGILSYRERFENVPSSRAGIGMQGGPSYADRNDVLPGLRGSRGFASIGEIMLSRLQGKVNVDTGSSFGGQDFNHWLPSWSIEFAGLAIDDQDSGLTIPPFEWMQSDSTIDFGAPLSTDIIGDRIIGTFDSDGVSGDVEELNLLMAGASNLVTTRSDVFIVHFKVRTFMQNAEGVWDATDPEYILDESRYVMMVDRSEVDSPVDSSRILFLEKAPTSFAGHDDHEG